MIDPLDLTGKKILVAGAASETGRAVVALLADLGAAVVMIDQEGEKLMEIGNDLASERVAYYSFDIYNTAAMEPELEKICGEQGVFDGFAFCAGIGGVRPLSYTVPAFTLEMMNANAFSFIEMVRCITKKNRFARGGSIVALSSVSSIKGLKSKTAYAASKAALDASVRCMAAELGPKGIRVNSLLKGWVDSDMQTDFIKSNMELNQGEDFQRQFLGMIPSGDVAFAIAFLLSDAAKRVTGITMLLDGGYTL